MLIKKEEIMILIMEVKRYGMSQVQCFYCKRFFHYEHNCRKKQKKQDHFYEEKGDVGTLLLDCDS
jgi:hypothetical protein